MYLDKIKNSILRIILAGFILSFSISCDRKFNNPVDPDVILKSIDNLTAFQDGEWIRLKWVSREDLRSGYHLERRRINETFTLIASIPNISITTYLDTTLVSNSEYHYRLRGYSDENKSGYSNIVSINSKFPAPYNLSSTILSDSSIQLVWKDSVDFSHFYLIEKQTDSDMTWKAVGETAPKVHKFIDLNAEYNINSRYRVTALTESNSSITSSSVEIIINLNEPQIESLNPLNDSQVQIDWSDINGFESGFTIERMSDHDLKWKVVGHTGANDMSLIDDSLSVTREYSYRIKANSTNHTSEFSSPLSVRTSFPAPTNLNISESAISTVLFSWDDIDFEEGYTLQYITDGDIDTIIIQLGQNENFYEIMDVDTNRVYHLKLYAFSKFNESGVNSALLQFSRVPRFHTSLPAHTDTITCLSFSGNSQILASGGDDFNVNIWSTDSWDKSKTISGHTVGEPVKTLDFVNNTFLAVGYQYSSLKLFENYTWEFDSDINLSTYELFNSTVSDGSAKFAVSKYKFVHVWEMDTWSSLNSFPASDRDIYDLVIENKGNWIAITDGASNIKIWDTGTWENFATLELHTEAVLNLDVSANDNFLASSGLDQKIIIWQVGDWSDVQTITDHTDNIEQLQFSPDDRYLASVQKNDNRIFLWDIKTWQLDGILQLSASSTITSLAFSLNSEMLVVGDSDGKLWVWNFEADWELISR